MGAAHRDKTTSAVHTIFAADARAGAAACAGRRRAAHVRGVAAGGQVARDVLVRGDVASRLLRHVADARCHVRHGRGTDDEHEKNDRGDAQIALVGDHFGSI